MLEPLVEQLKQLELEPLKAKFGTAAKTLWDYYLWPFKSFKHFGIALAAQQAVHAGLGLAFYPSVKDKLKEAGIPAEAAAKIKVPMLTFVRPTGQDRSWVDRIYSLTDAPTIWGPIIGLKQSFTYSSGYNFQTLLNVACDISLPKTEHFSGEKTISSLSSIPRAELNGHKISDKKLYAFFLAHELGHCKLTSLDAAYASALSFAADRLHLPFEKTVSGLRRQANLHEEEADINAINALSDGITRDTQAEEFALNFRSAAPYHILFPKLDSNHDLELYHYARMHGLKPPANEEMMDSRKEISTYMREKLEGHLEKGQKIRNDFEWTDLLPSLKEPPDVTSPNFAIIMLRHADDFLKEKKDTASPWALKRAELYIDGMRYFAPELVEEALAPPPAGAKKSVHSHPAPNS